MRILGFRLARPILSVLAIVVILVSTFAIISSPGRAAPHDRIIINGNADFTAANGVTGGAGTASDPYVISGWTIDAYSDGLSSIGVEVRNTTAFFTIRGVYVSGDGFGAVLSGVVNARIESSFIGAVGGGLGIKDSINVTLSGNLFSGGSRDLYGPGGGGAYAAGLSKVSNLTIIGNDFESFYTAFGISDCSHLLFSRNTANAGGFGNAAEVRGCSEVTISDSIFGGWEEINSGLSVSESTDVRILYNDVNGDSGIVVGGSTGLTLLGNNAYGDTYYGIELASSFDAIISGNLVRGNSGTYNEGIVLRSSNYTQISANNVTQESTAIRLSSATGILVYHNNLVSNLVRAVDDRGGENVWDSGYPSGGNFWSDYTGVDHCSGPNQDMCTGGDGIGDTPRAIDSDSRDRYPLMGQTMTPRPRLTTSFTWDPCCPTAGQSTTFTAGSSGGNGTYSHSWSFGDGSSATGNPVTHTYSTAGSFTVTLKTNDSGGQTASVAKTIIISPCQTLTFRPTADASIRADTPNTNYGSSTTLVVDASPLRNSLLKFSITGIGGCHVTSAKLRLFQVDSSSKGGDFHTMANTWSESTVTWNNAPAASPTTLASIGPVSAGNWYEVDLSSIVKGEGVVSLRATSPSSDGAYYSSREGPNPPQLVVTLSSTPAPTTRVLTLNPTDDAYIRADMASSNFGSDTRLVADASPLRDFLLKFTMSGIGSGQVVNAKLRLFQVDSSDRGGDLHTISTSWSESTVTWNNAPTSSATVGSIGPVSANTWYEVDVTSVVTGDGTVSFRISSPSSDGSYYSSKEGLNPPQLLITVSG